MRVCLDLHEEPDPANTPIRAQDLDRLSQLAWKFYLLCANQVIVSSVGVVGLSYSDVKAVFDIYAVPQADRVQIFEYIIFIYDFIEERKANPAEEANVEE